MRQRKQPRRSVLLRTAAATRPVSESLEPRWLLAAGDLDTTFGGGDGAVTAAFPGATHDLGQAMAVRPDGKIVVAGRTGDGTGNADKIALARFTTDGLLDSTFGGSDGTADGMVTQALGTNTDTDVAGIALQADGKIVVVGSYRTVGAATTDWFVARLNEDGSLDSTFGAGAGYVTRDFGSNGADNATAVALQADGKIVIAGVATQAGNANLAVARFNTDGTLDDDADGSGFSGDGIDTVDFSTGAVDYASDVIVDPDGKVVITGGSLPTGTYRQLVLLRYTPDGVLDATFDTDGKVSTDFGNAAIGRQLLRQPDGKYVVGGLAGPGSPQAYALARYTDTGALDTTFGTNGTTLVPALQGTPFVAQYGIAQQADGKILFGGYAQTPTTGSNTYFGVVRLTTAGAPDGTFGTAGVKTYSVPNTSAGFGQGADVALAADGNILLAGSAFANQNDFGVLKLNATGPDPVTLVGNVLTVVGTDGDDTLTLSADPTTFTAVFNGATFTFDAASVASLNVDLKAGNDTENHNGNVPGGTVNLGDGNDTLTVGTGNKTSPLLTINGGKGSDSVTLGVAFFTPVNFNGGTDSPNTGVDTLTYNGSQGDDDLLVTGTEITNEGLDSAQYSNLERVNLLGNFGFDTIRVQSSVAGTNYQLDAGDGDDQFLFSNPTNPDAFTANTTVIGGAGNDQITWDDSTNNNPDPYTITPTTFSRQYFQPVTYQSAETLRVTGASAGNEFAVTPSATTALFVDGGGPTTTPGDGITLSLTGATGIAKTDLATGSARYTFANRQPVEYQNMERDLTVIPDQPPAVTSSEFEYLTRQAITFNFSEDVSASVDLSDLVLTNLTTGQVIPSSSLVLNVTFGAGLPTTATWTTFAGQVLPDGNYTATLPKAGITDSTGKPLADDYTLSFYVLAGDANRDRVVNFSDLARLAQNYNKTGKTLADGDFNYDGTVNFSDLAALAQRYNKSLPAPVTPAALPQPTLAPATADLTTTTTTTSTKKRPQVFNTTVPVRPTPAPKPVARPVVRPR